MTFPLLRDAVRLVRRNPVLSAVAVLSLAIGITINATAFSVIDGLLLRPLPIDDPAGLVRLYTTATTGRARDDLTYGDFLDVQQSAKTLATLAAFRTAGAAIGNAGEAPELATLGIVSTNYFAVLGVNARLGRLFGEMDRDASSGAPAAVISARYWKRRFSADPNVLGRTIRLNTRAWTIVGVLPEGFGGTQPLLAPAVWVPVDVDGPNGRPPRLRDDRGFAVFGRLAPGARIEHVDAEVRTIGDALAGRYPDTNRHRGLTAEFAASAQRKNVSVIPLVVGIVSLPLLIACANVMGLLLGRSEERRREMAIRLALGGSRARLVRQLLAETTLLSALAVAASLLLALWILHLIPSVLPPLPIEVNLDFRIDARIGLATLAVALTATLLAGLAPALMASRTDLTPVIKGHAATTGSIGRRRITLRNALVTGQIAVMFLLLELAALFTTSFLNANGMDTGFAPGTMAFATMAPGAAGYDRPRANEFYRELLERVRRQPDVLAAAYAGHVPLNSLYGGGATENVAIAGHEPPRGHSAFDIRYNVVSPRYFETMGTRLLGGRDFEERDRMDGERVVVINETMARTFWPNDDPVGRRIDLIKASLLSGTAAPTGTERQPCVIVGVVQDTKYLTLRETTPPYMFFPMSQRNVGEITLVARGRGDEAVLAGELRRAIVAIDPELPAIDILTRSEHMHRALFAERTLAGTVTGLGAISLVLAMVGVYGVVAFAVSRRTREIGIEMALGASAGQVMRGVLGHGARLTTIGMLIGAMLGVALASVLAGSLYGVSAIDPRMFLAAAALTLPIALAASYLPARRAARIDPMAALRE